MLVTRPAQWKLTPDYDTINPSCTKYLRAVWQIGHDTTVTLWQIPRCMLTKKLPIKSMLIWTALHFLGDSQTINCHNKSITCCKIVPKTDKSCMIHINVCWCEGCICISSFFTSTDLSLYKISIPTWLLIEAYGDKQCILAKVD